MIIDVILIAISTGVIAAIGGALIAILIIVCRKYKKRHSKGKIKKENEVQHNGKWKTFSPYVTGHVDNDYSERYAK